MMTKNEINLLVHLAQYFADGGRDGDFDSSLVSHWSQDEINSFNQYIQSCDDEEEEDFDFRDCVSCQIVLDFLLKKLEEQYN